MTIVEIKTIKECITALNGYYPLIKHLPDVAEGMNITIDKLESLIQEKEFEFKPATEPIVYTGTGKPKVSMKR